MHAVLNHNTQHKRFFSEIIFCLYLPSSLSTSLSKAVALCKVLAAETRYRHKFSSCGRVFSPSRSPNQVFGRAEMIWHELKENVNISYNIKRDTGRSKSLQRDKKVYKRANYCPNIGTNTHECH